jgi:hypothetical protein
MDFQDPYHHQQTLATVRDRLTQHLAAKIPYHELSRARLTKEWQGLREQSFSLGDCRLIRGYLSLVAFEMCTGQVLSCQTRILELLTRMARRHLNTIKTLPAPATSSAQNAEHLLTCAWLLGAHEHAFSRQWASLLEQTSPVVERLVEAPSLHLHELDTPLLAESQTQFAALCQMLNHDLLLTQQASSLLIADYTRQFKTVENDPEWITLDHAVASDRITQTSGRMLEEFSRILEAEQQIAQRSMALVRHQFGDFLGDLARSAALLDTVLDRLDRYDREWFSRQFAHQPVHVENHVLICALAHELRMAGEELDHIEAFARTLKSYAREHNASCTGMLDDEITNLAQNISEQSILKALQRTRVSDPDCPLSIRHRNHISDVIKQADAALSHNDQASTPLDTGASSLSSASVPGVGSIKRSPWTI